MLLLLPAIGLFVAIREKNRPLLDVNIVLVLATLATNKPYLGTARQTWDPILLGDGISRVQALRPEQRDPSVQQTLR